MFVLLNGCIGFKNFRNMGFPFRPLRLPQVLLLLFLSCHSIAQYADNKYGLKVIADFEAYRNTVAADSANELIDLSQHIPGIVLDIRYATSNNFVNEPVYRLAAAFARRPVAEALLRVQQELALQGLGLKIYDAYRPYTVTVKFYEKTQDSVFVAVPWKGSRHNRGCAVDLTLVNLKTGKDVRMPTPYDEFSEKAHPDYADVPRKTKENRNLLISVMNKYGFTVYPDEWWHFDFPGWEKFDLMDIPFEELKRLTGK
jgi:D-alanyl-D-alanine dipeptidase